MRGTREYYDKTAAEWAENGYGDGAYLPCLNEFLSLLPPGGRVLDLCCGAGYETGRIRARGFEALGLDFSGGSLSIARARNPDIPFFQGDMLGDYSQVGMVDGILLSGGGDIDPLLFGEEPLRQNGEISPLRDSFELTLCRAALESGLPLFGICRGMQVMNIAAGGTIYQDIPAQTGSTLKHSQQAPRPHGTHSVLPLENSLLAALWGKNRVAVNSFHHQAVAQLGEGFSAAAHSPDGIIEAVEREDAPFVLGVQWHPEYLDRHRGIFNALATAGERFAAQREATVSQG